MDAAPGSNFIDTLRKKIVAEFNRLEDGPRPAGFPDTFASITVVTSWVVSQHINGGGNSRPISWSRVGQIFGWLEELGYPAPPSVQETPSQTWGDWALSAMSASMAKQLRQDHPELAAQTLVRKQAWRENQVTEGDVVTLAVGLVEAEWSVNLRRNFAHGTDAEIAAEAVNAAVLQLKPVPLNRFDVTTLARAVEVQAATRRMHQRGEILVD